MCNGIFTQVANKQGLEYTVYGKENAAKGPFGSINFTRFNDNLILKEIRKKNSQDPDEDYVKLAVYIIIVCQYSSPYLERNFYSRLKVKLYRNLAFPSRL